MGSQGVTTLPIMFNDYLTDGASRVQTRTENKEIILVNAEI